MTPTKTLVKCVAAYIVALVLAPLPHLVLGSPELCPWCIIALPSLIVTVFFLHGGPDPTPIIVVGYLVQMGLAAKAMVGHKESCPSWMLLDLCRVARSGCVCCLVRSLLYFVLMRPGE